MISRPYIWRHDFNMQGFLQQMEQIEFLNLVKQQVIVAILADDDLGDRLVLKGGNLLQFAYQLTVRASTDIDISVDGDFEDTQALSDKIKSCLVDKFSKENLVLLDFIFREVPATLSEDLEDFWGGYQCEFKLIEQEKHDAAEGDIESIRRRATPLNPSGSTRFKVDFSRHEFCGDKEEFEIDGHTVFGYSPRMFVAEKLRAICQQMPEYSLIVHRNRPSASRSRDFVDIHVIASHYGIDFSAADFHDVVVKTFKQKRVPVELIGKIKEVRNHHELDFLAVKDTVEASYDLQNFDFYFDYVCRNCAALESVWDK